MAGGGPPATSPPAGSSCLCRLSGRLEQAEHVVQRNDLGDHRHDHRDQPVPTEGLRQVRTCIEAGLDHVEHQVELLLALAWYRDCRLDRLNCGQHEGENLENDEQLFHWFCLPVEKSGRPGSEPPQLLRIYAGLGCVWEGVDAPPEAVTTTGTSAAMVCEMAAASALAITGVSDVNRFATLAVTASALTASPAPAAATAPLVVSLAAVPAGETVCWVSVTPAWPAKTMPALMA